MAATAPAVRKNQRTANNTSQSAMVLVTRFATVFARRATAGRHHWGPHLLARLAVAPLAPRVVRDGRREVGLREVGPEDGREKELGVGRLHQEEVAHARLARGPDHQVGVGHAGRVQVPGEGLPGRVVQLLAPRGDGGRIAACRVHDLGARPVVEREHERVVREGLRLLDRRGQVPAHARRQLVDAADRQQANSVANECPELLLQVALQEAH